MTSRYTSIVFIVILSEAKNLNLKQLKSRILRYTQNDIIIENVKPLSVRQGLLELKDKPSSNEHLSG
jgi:hypothetical protein